MFEFATATRIIFGENSVLNSIPSFPGFGTRAMVVLGLSETIAQPILDAIHSQGIEIFTFRVKGEPSIESVQNAIDSAKKFNADMVIGLGGGSALDTAKAVAAMLTNPGELLDYLEVVGKGKVISNPSLPCITIPTTSGTGSEVTRNAVLDVPEKAVKVSLRSPYMLARLAIIDPSLTLTLTPEITASSGMDALSQVIEPFISAKSNPMIDALCRTGIQNAGKSLRTAFFEGTNYAAREEMSLTSLIGGLALANAGLGAVHGFAAPLGGMFHAPHGVLCGRLLPAVMQINFEALLQRQPQNPVILRFHEIAMLLTGDSSAQPQQGIGWISDTCELLDIPRLAHFGITPR